jgi:uncharacterized protein
VTVRPDDTLLQFPCRFPIKAMGRASPDLQHTLEQLVRAHAPDLTAEDVSVTPSRQGTYLSVTITITATSRAQLDAIYGALSAHEAVLLAL